MAGDAKSTLLGYLTTARDALRWKLDGLGEYDLRRPLTPTGTNLLGLVKHVASVQAGYLGDVFGRPFPRPLPWFEPGAEPNADLWAAPDETLESILELFDVSNAHSDATVAALDLTATGTVPWWPDDRNPVTLHQILVHLVAETNRHAGHADIVRETIDGAVGLRLGNDNMVSHDDAWWTSYVERVEAAARAADGRADPA